MTMTLHIPDGVARDLSGTDEGRQRELGFALACGLFAMGEASSGVACELAGMSRLDFLAEYGRRGLPRPFAENDLADDLAFASHR